MTINQKVKFILNEGYKIRIEDVGEETCITAYIDVGCRKIGTSANGDIRCYGDTFYETLNEVYKEVTHD